MSNIQSDLENLANPKLAASAQRYFKTAPGQYGAGDIFRGIRAPAIKELVSKYNGLPQNEVKQLLKSNFHEDRATALLILVKQFGKADESARTRTYELYLKSLPFINNWDLVDCSAHHIVGAYLSDKDRQPLYKLAHSTNLWHRRIAIISTLHFIRNHDFTDTLAISEILLPDHEDLIHKATGWMLREVGKRDLNTELAFLDKHTNRMPRTMLRYAIEKFPTALRLSYLSRPRTPLPLNSSD